MDTAADSPAFTLAGRTVPAPFAKAFEPRRFAFLENAAVSVTDACSGIEGTITLITLTTPDEVNQENFVESYGVSFSYAKFSIASCDGTSFSGTGYADENGNYAAYFPDAGTYTITTEIATDRVLLSSSGEVSDCASCQSFTMAADPAGILCSCSRHQTLPNSRNGLTIERFRPAYSHADFVHTLCTAEAGQEGVLAQIMCTQSGFRITLGHSDRGTTTVSFATFRLLS